MTRSTTEEAAHDLGKAMGHKQPIAGESTREPQEESLKHHGDDLQDLVDKATGSAGAVE